METGPDILAEHDESRRQRGWAWAVAIALVLAVFAVFGQTLRFDYVNFDDNVCISDNPQVAGGLTRQGIVWAFTQRHQGLWQPLTWLSLMADREVFGRLPRWLHFTQPGWFHFTNVLLHAAATVLLFLVLWRMTGRLWPAAFVAALFAIHPLRAESVAWITERKDVLSGVFFMLVLAAYVAYTRVIPKGDSPIFGPTLRSPCPKIGSVPSAKVFPSPLRGGHGAAGPGIDGQAGLDDGAVRAASVGFLAAGADNGRRQFGRPAAQIFRTLPGWSWKRYRCWPWPALPALSRFGRNAMP